MRAGRRSRSRTPLLVLPCMRHPKEPCQAVCLAAALLRCCLLPCW